MKKISQSEVGILRLKAEEMLNSKQASDIQNNASLTTLPVNLLEADTLKLIHELQVHQIELEMQAQELKVALSEAQNAIDLNDFAPIGYFTLSRNGDITALNLCGSLMLGKDRSHLKNIRFDFFVSNETKPAFNLFLDKIFSSSTKTTCEITLITEGNLPIYLLLTGLATENNEQCLLTATDITERKRAEEALLENEALYRGIIEASPDVITITDLQGLVKFTSPKAIEMFGYENTEVLLNQSVFNFIDKKDHKRGAENLQLVFHGLEQGGIEYTAVRCDGSTFDVEINGELIKDAEGVPKGMVFITRDISDRKKSEVALHASEALYRAILDASPDDITITDLEGRILIASPSSLKLMGNKSFDEIIGHSIFEFIVPEEFERAKSMMVQLFMGMCTGPAEYKGIRADGSIIDIEVNGEFIRDESGKPQSIVFVIRNITDRKQAEKKLLKNEERFRQVVEQSEEVVWEVDAEGLYTYLSPLAISVYGYAPEQLIGKFHFYDLHPEEAREEFKDAAFEVFSRKESFHNLVSKNKKPDGTINIIRTNGVPMIGENGNLIGYRGTDADVTELKQAEDIFNARLRLTEFAITHSRNELQQQLLAELEILTNSSIGFFHTVDADQNTLSLQSWSTNTLQSICNVENLNPHFSLDKAGVWADCVRQRKAVIHNDFKSLNHQKEMPTGHVPVIRELVVPIFRNDLIVAIVGMGNKSTDYHESDIKFISLLSDLTWDIAERKGAEEVNKKLSQAVEQSPVMTFITDLNGDIEYTNTKTLALTGYTQDEIIGKNPRILSSGEKSKEDYCILWETLKSGKEWRGEFHNKKKNGEHFWTSASISPIFDANAMMTHYLSVQEDITERKKAEDQLRNSEEKYRNIFESVQDAYFEASMDGTLIEISPSIEIISKGQYTRDEMIGKSFTYVYANPEDRNSYFSKLFKENVLTDYELLLQNKDGSIIPVAVSAVLMYNADSKPEKITGIIRDITERKKAEEELRKFRTISDKANYGVSISSLDGIFIYVNDAFANMFGWEVNDLIGKSYLVVHNQEQFPRAKELVSLIRNKWGFASEELFHTRKDGSTFPALMTANIIFDEKHIPLFLSTTTIDISKIKQSEEALKQSEADLNYSQQIAKMGSWQLDVLSRKLTWSKNFYSLLGLDPSNILIHTDSFYNIVHPDDLHLLDEKLQEIYQNRTASSVDLRLIMPDGSIKWVLNNIVPEFEGDTLISLKGVNINITEKKLAKKEIINLNENLELKVNTRTKQLSETNLILQKEIEERKRTEEALKESKMQFSLFMDYLPALIFIKDFESTIIYGNIAIDNALGASKWKGLKVTEIFDEETAQRILTDDKKTFETGYQKIEESFPNLDGKIHHYETYKFTIPRQGQTTLLGGIAIDITERKQHQDALNQLTTRLTLALRVGHIGVWDFDPVNNILVWDDQMFALYGIDKMDFGGAYEVWQSSLHPDDREQSEAELAMAISGEKEFDTEFRIVWPDGNIHNIRAIAIVERNSEGKPINMIGTNWDITEHKQAEASIEQTRLNYETFFNTIDDFLFVFDDKGNILHTNTTVTERLEYSTEELLGKSIFKLHPAERSEEIMRIFGGILAGTSDFCTMPFITKSGNYIPIETKVKAGFWDGEPAFFRVSKDISKIQLSEEKFSKAFQFNSSLMAISGFETKQFIDVNQTFTKTLGYTRDEIIGKKASEIKIFNDQKFQNTITEKLKQNIPVRDIEVEARTKSGNMIFGLFSADFIYVGKDKCLLTMMLDITERKRAEEEIIRQSGLITSLLDSIPDIIFFKDINGVYLGCNPTFAEFTGKLRKDIIGKTDYDLFDKEIADHFRYNDNKMLEEKQSRHNEEWITFPDGRAILVDTLKTTYTGSDGSLIGVLGISRDITERKQAEEAIIQARKEADKANHAKSDFLSRMSHELRTPMNSILGFAQLMEMGELNRLQARGVNNILNSGRHLLKLINEVLDLARIEAGRILVSPEPIQLSGVILEMLDVVNPQATKFSVKTELAPSLANSLFVLADRQLIKQVLLNLISNAVKYNREGGSVLVKTELMPKNCSGIAFVRISISDTGGGISSEDIQKLFIPFERIGAEYSNIEGTGLGLAVVKKLMDAMGGNIGVESVPGDGSTFWFELPWVENKTDKAEKTNYLIEAASEQNGKTGTILYIEDNFENVELIEQILASQRSNIRLVTDVNGSKAVNLAIEFAADLILLDINLPGIQGNEVIELVQANEKTKAIPIVIISADAMPEQIEKILKTGVCEYLTKPLDVAKFLWVVDGFFNHIETLKKNT